MHPHKEALPFNVNKQRGVTEEHHTAYSCTIVMNTREAESGAGEAKENETGGCMGGQRHKWTDGWISDLICPLPDSASTNSESGTYCSPWRGCRGARYTRTDSLWE